MGEFLPQVGCSSNVTLFLSPINTKKHSSTVIKIPTMPTPQLSVTFYTMGLFGWVANSQPGSRKPPSGCLVGCLEAQARLQEANNHPLAWLQKNAGAGRSLGARLG